MWRPSIVIAASRCCDEDARDRRSAGAEAVLTFLDPERFSSRSRGPGPQALAEPLPPGDGAPGAGRRSVARTAFDTGPPIMQRFHMARSVLGFLAALAIEIAAPARTESAG